MRYWGLEAEGRSLGPSGANKAPYSLSSWALREQLLSSAVAISAPGSGPVPAASLGGGRDLQLQVKAAWRGLHNLLTDLPCRPQGSQGYSRFPPVAEARKGPAGPDSPRLDHRKPAPHPKKVSLGMLTKDVKEAPDHSPTTQLPAPPWATLWSDHSLGCPGSELNFLLAPVGISVLRTAFLRVKPCSEDTP